MPSATSTNNWPMLHVALFQPEIAPNTGNIIRLCANSGAQLHLIHPLGFNFDDRKLRRAGLDYHEYTNVQHHQNYAGFEATLHPQQRIFACTTKTQRHYTSIRYQAGDVLLFGPETRGLPEALRENPLRIPMRPQSRSINLANAVSIVLYEAWRQLGFIDLI